MESHDCNVASEEYINPHDHELLTSVEPVSSDSCDILPAYRQMDPVCDPKWTSDRLSREAPAAGTQRESWDINNSLQTAEWCVAYKKVPQDFLSKHTFSELRILFFSGFSDSLLSVCPVFCFIATWNQVKVTRCGRRCFACHHGEPKACFAVASSLFGEQAQDRVLAICSHLSCGNGWVACLAPLNVCSAERTESEPARSWLYWSAEEQQRAQEFIRDLRKTELL